MKPKPKPKPKPMTVKRFIDKWGAVGPRVRLEIDAMRADLRALIRQTKRQERAIDPRKRCDLCGGTKTVCAKQYADTVRDWTREAKRQTVRAERAEAKLERQARRGKR